MNLEQQVCSLDLAKRLKGLGVKQESLFWWQETNNGNAHIFIGATGSYSGVCIAAFTVAELGEMLPEHIVLEHPTSHTSERYFFHYWNQEGTYIEYSYPGISSPKRHSHCGHWVSANTEADARAKMLVYLLENKLITL